VPPPPTRHDVRDRVRPRADAPVALLLLLLLLVLVLVAAGCNGKGPRGPKREYVGPTESMSNVVGAINANNARLPTLWMRHDFDGRIVEPDPKRPKDPRVTNVSGDGVVMYRSPQELRFNVGGPGVGDLFVVGSNPQRYWLWIPFSKVNTLWWGRYEHLGAPCADPIPVRPDLLLEVLGVSTVDQDFTRLPAPTMTFDGVADAYVFTWVARAPDRFVALKEVWYDRKTKRPTRVRLFDDNGRVLLRAQLSEFNGVELPDVPRDQRPVVAHRYDLEFPDTGSTMRITVSEARLSNKGRPNDLAFQFPSDPGDSKVIQLDEACGP
jgi:hypothetical protein